MLINKIKFFRTLTSTSMQCGALDCGVWFSFVDEDPKWSRLWCLRSQGSGGRNRGSRRDLSNITLNWCPRSHNRATRIRTQEAVKFGSMHSQSVGFVVLREPFFCRHNSFSFVEEEVFFGNSVVDGYFSSVLYEEAGCSGGGGGRFLLMKELFSKKKKKNLYYL